MCIPPCHLKAAFSWLQKSQGERKDITLVQQEPVNKTKNLEYNLLIFFLSASAVYTLKNAIFYFIFLMDSLYIGHLSLIWGDLFFPFKNYWWFYLISQLVFSLAHTYKASFSDKESNIKHYFEKASQTFKLTQIHHPLKNTSFFLKLQSQEICQVGNSLEQR